MIINQGLRLKSVSKIVEFSKTFTVQEMHVRKYLEEKMTENDREKLTPK